MIPSLVTAQCGQPDVLPPGVHPCTFDQMTDVFGWTEGRKWLLDGLEVARSDLVAAGCARIYLGGSFVTSLPEPSDFDGCWDPVGVDRKALHRMYQEMPAMKAHQKGHHRGELWIGNHQIPGFDGMLKFFQADTRRGIAQKGILAIPIA